MATKFPTKAFFDALCARVGAESGRFEKLGWFDTTFGIRVLRDHDSKERLFLLEFDTYACRGIRELPADRPPEAADFVLEAPYRVWHEMLTSVDRRGRIDLDHSINTLTHHDAPIRVASADPVGHDKLFRFQESIQLVFDLAAGIEGAA